MAPPLQASPPPSSPPSYSYFDPFRFGPPVPPGGADVTRTNPRRRRGPIFADGDPARRGDAPRLSDSPPPTRARRAVSEAAAAAAPSNLVSFEAASSIAISKTGATAPSIAISKTGATATSVAIAESETDPPVASAQPGADPSAPAASTSGCADPPFTRTSARGRSRGRARRRGRRAGRRPSPVLPAGTLAPSTGPADGQSKEEFASSRFWDLNAEYELLDEGRKNIETFAAIPYVRKARVDGAWAKFRDRVDVCIAVRNEIRAVHKWVDDVPSEFIR